MEQIMRDLEDPELCKHLAQEKIQEDEADAIQQRVRELKAKLTSPPPVPVVSEITTAVRRSIYSR